jgi:hypothetical protein
MERYVSEPIEHPRARDDEGPAVELYRADLVFYDVDATGPSYVGLVFLHSGSGDVPEYGPDDDSAGWFTVFGHGGCFGDDERHCEPPPDPPDPFDLTFPIGIPRQTKTVHVTEALQAIEAETFRVCVVAVVPEDERAKLGSDVLSFGRLRLLTYA